MRVVSLYTYPIKGCHRVEVHTAEVQPWGLAGDRRWLLVEPGTGVGITQRDEPRLTAIQPLTTPAGLTLRTPGHPDLQVPAPAGGAQVEVDVWRNRMKAARAGAEADAWLSTALGRQVWLVHLDDPTQRPVQPEYAQPDDRVSFADAYPVLLANAASLEALNGWLEEPVPITRFRPNVVLDGAQAWAEDGWVGGRLRIGSVQFRAPKPCDRCVVTTIDQETGVKGRQPLFALGEHRKFPGGLMFGMNLIPDGVGSISVGDPVEFG